MLVRKANREDPDQTASSVHAFVAGIQMLEILIPLL